MKKAIKILILIPLCGLLLLLAGFLALTLYYRDHFPVNTWINGIYCTGKTLEEVNAELIAQTELPVIRIKDAQGQEWEIAPEKVGLAADYTASLREYLRTHTAGFWLFSMQDTVRERLTQARYTWDEALLTDALSALEPVQEAESEGGFRIVLGENGYAAEDKNSARPDVERMQELIREKLAAGVAQIDLSAGGCYRTAEDSKEDAAQRALWSSVEEFLDCGIVYDMGAETIVLTPEILSTFLAADEEQGLLSDENGCPVVDEKRVAEWVEALAGRYDTVETEREFQSTRGDIVTVSYVTYGTKLDTEAETAYLMEALQREHKEPENHIPAYEQEGFARGLDDIGDTYIEVDMTQQHMYYYEDGALKLDTDVVTGKTSRRMGTPEGINFVYNKQKDRILRGADYATPVKYWMPIKGGVGIHDADWRKKFGGEIYKNGGSHGCINTPPDVMKELYEMVEIGTPVITFY